MRDLDQDLTYVGSHVENQTAYVEYSMLPEVAVELATVLEGAGSRTNDAGWLADAAKLRRAAHEAEDGSDA